MSTDPAYRVQRAALNSILRGAEAGHYQLAGELHAAMRAEKHIAGQVTEARAEAQRLATVGDVTAGLAGDVVAAARRGEVLAGLADRVAEVEQAARRSELHRGIVDMAAQKAAMEVLHAVSAERIIRESLVPAFDELLAAVAKAAGPLKGHDVTDAGPFLRAPEGVRRAYTSLQDAVERYRALRVAQTAALRLSPPTTDRAHWFAEFERPDELEVRLGVAPDHPLPWPNNPAARLLWVADKAQGNVWMPDGGQMDDAHAAWDQRTRSKRPRPVGLVVAGL